MKGETKVCYLCVMKDKHADDEYRLFDNLVSAIGCAEEFANYSIHRYGIDEADEDLEKYNNTEYAIFAVGMDDMFEVRVVSVNLEL